MTHSRSQDPEDKMARTGQRSSEDSPPPSTRFNPDTAREAAKKSAEVRRAKKAEREKVESAYDALAGQGAEGEGAEVVRNGLVAWLREIAEDKNRSDRVQAIRTIAELTGAGDTEKPRTTEALARMTRAERQALIKTLELAHSLPDPETPSVHAG